VEILTSVTKADVLSLYKTHVHHSSPTRAKTSVHLRSQKPRAVRVSEGAITAFERKAKDAGLKTEATSWKDELFSHGEPLLAQATSYWRPLLLAADSGVSSDVTEKLIETLPQLAKDFPAHGNDEGKLRSEAVIIDDVQAIRASRKVTEHPVPAVEWGDLPLSKI
jgi:insulysin